MPWTASALAAVAAGAASVGFDELKVAAHRVWWLQSRPEQDGRTALMCGTSHVESSQVTPPSDGVGSRIHAYGGGAFAVDDQRAWYVNAAESCIDVIDWQAPGSSASRAVAEVGAYGDLSVNAGRLLAVRETTAGDELVDVPAPGLPCRVLRRTDGFFAAPRAAGGALAWVEWSPDRMPWDDTRLWVAPLTADGLGAPRLIAGGRNESVAQPCWAPDGTLLFVSDRSGWWNLYRFDGTTVTTVVPMLADVAPAGWELGYASYTVLSRDRVAMIVHEGPQHRLIVAGRNGKAERLDVGYTSFKPYLAGDGDRLYGIAASPAVAPRVIAIDVCTPTDPTVVAESPGSEPVGQQLSVPEVLQIPVAAGVAVTALVYPPVGASADWSAPLVIRAHPGPTSSITTRLDRQVQFLTSHGIAVADVDYRGSTGYGRTFRQSLYGGWGRIDVDDCTAAATHLLTLGRARPGEVFIAGASAGGYTALQAVSRRSSVFAGAVARSAIVDPVRWQLRAPRWQRPHAVRLTSSVGAVRPDAVERPVLLIHGADDHIAPVDDVVALAQGLCMRGMVHELIVLGAAGHTLTGPQELTRALNAELAFYQTRLGS